MVDIHGSTASYYKYDPYGNAIQAAGCHCNINPLRYRGYVYDNESGFYYLQSRYYDSKICRFINADSFASTGQGPLGYKMFAYCNNNPVIYLDPDGQRVVGYGVQIEGQLGDVSIGAEFVLYTDPQVCGNSECLLVVYYYTGYEVSIGKLDKLGKKIEALLMIAATEEGDECFDAFIGAVTSFLNGMGASGGAFVIDAEDDFVSPEDYSGSFETMSLFINCKGVTVTGFHSYSDKCDTYGAKIGVKISGILPQEKRPFGLSYSRTEYSDPAELARW